MRVNVDCVYCLCAQVYVQMFTRAPVCVNLNVYMFVCVFLYAINVCNLPVRLCVCVSHTLSIQLARKVTKCRSGRSTAGAQVPHTLASPSSHSS